MELMLPPLTKAERKQRQRELNRQIWEQDKRDWIERLKAGAAAVGCLGLIAVVIGSIVFGWAVFDEAPLSSQGLVNFLVLFGLWMVWSKLGQIERMVRERQ